MDNREMQELFKATANVHTPEGLAAYKAFAAALTTPILQKIELESIMRKLFAVERLAAGAQAVYPVAEDFEISYKEFRNLTICWNVFRAFSTDIVKMKKIRQSAGNIYSDPPETKRQAS